MIDVIRPDIQIVSEHYDPKVAVPWDSIQPGIRNPVSNTNHDYLKFINTDYFSEEARHYLKYGYYTSAEFNSKDYIDYWDEQERRVNEGYTVGGVRIPGRYYYFLNFGMIKARPIDPLTGIENINARCRFAIILYSGCVCI